MADTTDFPHASALDGVRFTAQVGVPGVVTGLFRKRGLPAKVAATVKVEAQGFQLVQGLVRRYRPDPFYIRVALEEALLVHEPDDIRVVLGGSPDPFASDPETKRKGMTAFQPDALTLSRGDLWRSRRAFAEAVLDTGKPLHRQARRMLAVAAEEADLLAARERFGFDDVNESFRRLTRRVVFGDAAADDTDLSERLAGLMSEGNRTPGKPSTHYEPFVARIQEYVDAPDPDALTGLIGAAGYDGDTPVAGQLVHWLFAMGDTLPTNLYRCLALLGSHPEQLHEARNEVARRDASDPAGVVGMSYLAGCIQEAMRLWPTTPLFGRVTTREVRFPSGAVLPEGTQVLIYNVFNHRNRDRLPYADRFAPGEWSGGDAADDWGFNFFSHGPQGCPGAGMSVYLSQAFLARLLTGYVPQLGGASLDSRKGLPYGLDVTGFQIGLAPGQQ